MYEELFVGRIPARLRLHGLLSLKHLLKRAVANRLPSEILGRGKQGFTVPLGEWFRGTLARPLRALLPDRLRSAGIFDPSAVARLVDEHVAGRRSHASILWSLVAFEAWRAHYLGDGSPLG